MKNIIAQLIGILTSVRNYMISIQEEPIPLAPSGTNLRLKEHIASSLILISTKFVKNENRGASGSGFENIVIYPN